MARKPRRESAAKISPDLLTRIVKVAELVWKANQSQMGRDLGVGQSAISKVLAGKQEPSAKLLEKLATWPGVNPSWLFRGQGEPLVEVGAYTGVGHFLPLLDELLPGAPGDYRDRLSGVSYPVAAAFHTRSAYWYRLPRELPQALKKRGVNGGDLLLMETAPTWTQQADGVLGRVCGVRVSREKKEEVLLAYIDKFDHNTSFNPFQQYALDLFGMGSTAWLLIENKEEPVVEVPHPQGICLTLEQITCVCLKLERSFGPSSRT